MLIIITSHHSLTILGTTKHDVVPQQMLSISGKDTEGCGEGDLASRAEDTHTRRRILK